MLCLILVFCRINRSCNTNRSSWNVVKLIRKCLKNFVRYLCRLSKCKLCFTVGPVKIGCTQYRRLRRCLRRLRINNSASKLSVSESIATLRSRERVIKCGGFRTPVAVLGKIQRLLTYVVTTFHSRVKTYNSLVVVKSKNTSRPHNFYSR